MAVLTIEETTTGNSTEWTDTGRVYRRSWVCTTELATDTAELIVAAVASEGAYVGALHPDDIGARCRAVRPTRNAQSGTAWNAVAEYSTGTQIESSEQAANPIEYPASISLEFARHSKPIQKDLDGKPIANSVGVAFDPPIEMLVIRPRLVVVQNEVFTTVEQMAQKVFALTNSINTVEFLQADPRTLLAYVTATLEYENAMRYWAVRYELEHNPDGWNKEGSILDAGFSEWGWEIIESVHVDKLIPIKIPRWDEFGGDVIDVQASTEPWPLNGEGRALTKEQADDPEQHVYRQFRLFHEMHFSLMELRLP